MPGEQPLEVAVPEGRLGEMLREQPKNEGGWKERNAKSCSPESEPQERRPTLSDAGIDKKLSSRDQKLATVRKRQRLTPSATWRCSKSMGATESEKKTEACAKGNVAQGKGRTVIGSHSAPAPASKPTATQKTATDLGVKRETASRRVSEAAKETGMERVMKFYVR